jgi:hypothetical protein
MGAVQESRFAFKYSHYQIHRTRWYKAINLTSDFQLDGRKQTEESGAGRSRVVSTGIF